MAGDKLFQDTETQYGGGMKFNEGFILKISGEGGSLEGLIVQDLNIGVNRPITPLYDLTSNKVYYVSGRSSSQASLSRVCGPRGIVREFYMKLGDVCKADENTMSFAFPSGCPTQTFAGNSSTLMINNCVLTAVSFACNVQQYTISENCQIQGTELCVA